GHAWTSVFLRAALFPMSESQPAPPAHHSPCVAFPVVVRHTTLPGGPSEIAHATCPPCPASRAACGSRCDCSVPPRTPPALGRVSPSRADSAPGAPAIRG